MPSEIPVKIVENAATFSGYNRALTRQEINAQSIYLDESLKDSTTLASVLFDYQAELPFPEIQKEFLEARENGTLEEKLPDLIARTKDIILTGFQDAALEGKAAYDARTDKDDNNDTPPPQGASETPTNQAWIRDVNKLAKVKVATEILAPNGDYVIIIPKGVEFGGFLAKEPMMRIVAGIDGDGEPIYQVRPLDQGIVQTKKRK